MVRELLKNSKVDPSANDNQAIGIASQHGHVKIVKLLLEDKRVDPSDNKNYAIRIANQMGHKKVLS